MDYLENLLAIRAAFTFDEQIRYMGWGLLLLWMLSITYMTREFWFPSTFGTNSPRQEQKSPPRTRKKPISPQCFSTTKLNLTITQLSDSELRMFVDEVQRKCEYYLSKRECLSSKE
ncbi:unnamed protein product [Cylicocyclus nassatus]|uniref:Uncharacterized protein n=1 Tax=Cylicocyclus nassatus TaxID=53992 RepID=A0AA36H131_CYLNA|nr:unnamed protein product [Cylicocyclus nassatus]